MDMKSYNEDKTQNLGQQQPYKSTTTGKLDVRKQNVLEASHPIACFFHMGLKFFACLLYLMMGFFTDDEVLIFIVCLFLCCADFWATKNITGRYMVGLRWWSASDFGDDFDGDGWFFESFDYHYENTTFDNHIFWWSQIFSTIFWCIFVIIKTLGLDFFWVIL